MIEEKGNMYIHAYVYFSCMHRYQRINSRRKVSNITLDADGNVDCGLNFRCRPLFRVVS